MAARGACAAAALAMGMKSNSMAIAFKPTGLLQIRTQSGPNQSACPPTEVPKQGNAPVVYPLGITTEARLGICVSRVVTVTIRR